MRRHAIEGATDTPTCQCDLHNNMNLPKVDGHIMFTGEDLPLDSTHRKVLMQNCNNIPVPENTNITENIVNSFQKLCKGSKSPWSDKLLRDLAETCTNPELRLPKHTNTFDEVSATKKLFKNLVACPLDKKLGKLIMCCPCLYKKCMEKTYDLESNEHYKVKYIRPHTPNIEQENAHDVIANMTTDTPPDNVNIDQEDDLLKHWKTVYHKKGWHKICQFDDKGRLGYMYAIFKNKNTIDQNTRESKYKKARTITPYYRHPMKKLLKYAAKGWMFIIKQLKGSHFILPTCKDFGECITKCNDDFDQTSDIVTKSWDISGYYTNVPKSDIMTAMKTTLKIVKNNPTIFDPKGYYADMKSPAITAKVHKEMINLPKHGKGSIYWGSSHSDDRINLSFKNLIDIVEFSVNNAFFTLGDKIIQQTNGIPMGDPLSPAICIATCAMFEMSWFDKLTIENKEHLHIKRYLDDIYMVADKNKIPTIAEITRSISEDCYPKCLELESTPDDEYLECKVFTDHSSIYIQHWNKNHDHIKSHGTQKHYKHQHYDSYTTAHTKRGALIGTWTRMGIGL